MDSDPVRRLCAAVRAQGPSRARAADPHRWLLDVVREACAAADLDRLFLQEQWSGAGNPGLVLVMPPGVHEARVIDDLTRELRRAARRSAAWRLRLAFHQGITRLGPDGFEGRAVTAVSGMCAVEKLDAELSADPRCDLALIISSPLFDEITQPEFPVLRQDRFRRVGVEVPGAKSPMPAWIRLFGPEIAKNPEESENPAEAENGERSENEENPTKWRSGRKARTGAIREPEESRGIAESGNPAELREPGEQGELGETGEPRESVEPESPQSLQNPENPENPQNPQNPESPQNLESPQNADNAGGPENEEKSEKPGNSEKE
ncbi:hypothetical protein [Sphaerisporangium album]|uniref:hypothetical protein n=1 Tax=Sphaerisporangium album TaxID=509200 RepID=UPI0011C08364|nr:hypothetical protein [Sphaerisporangium album]